MMRSVLVLMVGVFLAATVAIADDAKSPSAAGYAILKKAETALKKVEHAKYDAEYKATGWVAQFVPTVKGKAIVGPRSKWDIERFRAQVRIEKADSDEVKDWTAGSNGNVYFLIDQDAKTVYVDMDPEVLGTSGRDIQRVVLKEFVSSHPFGEDVKLETVTLQGEVEVNGATCFEILIKGDQPPDVYWYFSKLDFLPRRVKRVYPNRKDPEGEVGTTELTLSRLTINPKFNTSPFKVLVPVGYRKTDEFAP